MRKPPWFLFILLLFVLAGQCVYFAWTSGQTVDETFYNGSGYPMVRYNHYGFLGEHPPLMMQLGSLPLLLIQPDFPIDSPVRLPGGDLTTMDLSKTGSKFLYEMGNDPHFLLFLERLPVIFLTLLVALVLFRWAYALYGAGGALLSLFLLVTCPNILAHGSLFTTDMGVTAFIFFTMYRLKIFFETPSPRNAVFAGMMAGLAMLSKMSALSLMPITFLLFALWGFSQKKSEMPVSSGFEGKGFLIAALCFFILTTSQKMIFVFFGPLCIVGAGTYAFKVWGAGLPGRGRKIFLTVLFLTELILSLVIFSLGKKQGLVLQMASLLWSFAFVLIQVILLKEWLYDFWRPLRFYLLLWLAAACVIMLGFTDLYQSLPRWRMFARYIRSFNIAYNHSQHYHVICLANSFITCDWRYFITTLFAKTPVVTQILFLSGVVSLFWLKLSKLNRWLILVPPFLFLIIASFLNRINIGLRHVLPLYPFVFLAAGAVVPVLCAQGSPLPRFLKRIALCLLVLGISWQAHRHVTIVPFYLSYFNEIIGSTEAGARLTADSNVNWGQDHLRLFKALKEMGNPPVKIGFASTYNEPEIRYYGIQAQLMTEEDYLNPSPGYYILDVHLFIREQSKAGSWFKGKQPDRRISPTLYLFKVPPRVLSPN